MSVRQSGITDEDAAVMPPDSRPPPPVSLHERALAHAYHLAGTLGPRPAGSHAEEAAFRYIAAQLAGAPLTFETHPVPFAPHARRVGILLTGALALLTAALLLSIAPWLTAVALVTIIAVPDGLRLWSERRPRTQRSQNLLALSPGAAEAPTLVFSAHVDSAPASALPTAWLRSLHSQIAFVALRVAWALLALGVLLLLGVAVPGWVVDAARWVGLATGAAWLALEIGSQARRNRFSPGANDNASGAGLLLALAEHYAQHPPARLRLGFLFTGAEETGLHGAHAGLEPLRRYPRLAVLNLDMVGVGRDLFWLSGDGALRPVATDAQLNQLIATADPGAAARAFPLRSGDHAVFLRAGLRASALQTGPDPAYHTLRDTPDRLDPAVLERVANCLTRLVGLADVRGFPER
jgi:hypothetical protein